MIDHLRRQAGSGMTAGNMRENGVRNLLVSCADCHHEALLNIDTMPDHVEIHSLDNRLVYTKCGSKSCSLMPNWAERPKRLQRRHGHLGRDMEVLSS